jgi:hypothetical protein
MFYLLKGALCGVHLSLLLCVTSIIDERLYLKLVTLVRYKPVYKLSYAYLAFLRKSDFAMTGTLAKRIVMFNLWKSQKTQNKICALLRFVN